VFIITIRPSAPVEGTIDNAVPDCSAATEDVVDVDADADDADDDEVVVSTLLEQAERAKTRMITSNSAMAFFFFTGVPSF